MSAPFMTVQDVAEFLKLDPKTVYRLLKRGDIPGFKVGGSWRIDRDDLVGWIESQKEEAAKQIGGRG